MHINNIVNFINTIANKFINKSINNIRDISYVFKDKSDEELKNLAKEALAGKQNFTLKKDKSLLSKIFTFFKQIVTSDLDEVTKNNLALGVEIFNRAPADLEIGSKLYPEQIEASIMIMHGMLIQMNTGEGKTYAILPSAFTLACKYDTVYIICANKQLAIRDARRTKPYWDFIGLNIGLFIDSSYENELDYRVIYTTLDNLIFYSLDKEISINSKNKIKFFAVILDEADSILLDQASQNFSLVEYIEQESYDWSLAINITKELIELEHIIVDMKNMSCTLTEKGEKLLLQYEDRNNIGYLLLRKAVETSYFATKKLKEGIDYVITGDNIHPVNSTNGLIEYNQSPIWLTPIKYIHGFDLSSESISLNSTYPTIFLNNFEHLSGLSGTIESDIGEYFFSYLLNTYFIKPRYPKNETIEDDLIFPTKNGAYTYLLDIVNKILKYKRPILIGTQNISEAEIIYQLIREYLPSDVNLFLLTGKNEKDSIKIFELAGEINTITIATQLAGRGVDIRLSEEAKSNGGMVLLSIEHALENRHDKQFFGRVGRHGDPYDVLFICSLEDNLLLRFGAKAIKDIMDKLKIEDNEFIESNMVTKAVGNAQNQISYSNFVLRRHEKILNESFENIKLKMVSWFDYLKMEDKNNNTPSKVFINWSIDNFITEYLIIMKKNERITVNTARNIKEILIDKLNLMENELFNIVATLEGLTYEQAKIEIAKFLNFKIEESFKKYQEIVNFFNNITKDNLLSLVEKKEHIYNPEWTSLVDTEVYNQNKKQDENDDKINVEDINEPFKSINPFNLTFLEILKVYDRKSKEVAKNILLLNWSTFLSEKDRIYHQVSVLNYSIFEKSRVINKMVTDKFEQTEANLSIEIIKHLLNSHKSHLFDDIFFLVDNKANITYNDVFDENIDYMEYKNSRKEKSSLSNELEVKTENIERDILIEPFSTYYLGNNKYKDTDIDLMKEILHTFLGKSPLFQLQQPSGVLNALDKWDEFQLKLGIELKNRKRNRKWIDEFLKYLKKQNNITALPKFYDKVKNNFVLTIGSLKQARVLLPSIAMLFSIIFITLLTYTTFNYFPQILQFNFIIPIIDDLFFLGVMQTGAMTTPIILSIIFTYIVLLVIRRGNGSFFGAWLEKYILSAFLISITIYLLYISGCNDTYFLCIFSNLLLFILIYITTLFLYSTIVYANNEVTINLVEILLLISVFFIFSNNIIFSNTLISYKLILIFSILIYYLVEKFSFEEMTLSTIRIKDSRSFNKETVNSVKKIVNDIGFLPYILSILLSLSFFELMITLQKMKLILIEDFYINFTTIAIYYLTLNYLIVDKFNKTLSFEKWKEYLHEHYLIIKNINSDDELKVLLRNIARKLIIQRILLFTFISILVYLYSSEINEVYLKNYPIYLIVLSTTIIFALLSNKILKQFYSIFINNTLYIQKSIDVEKESKKDEDLTFFQRFFIILDSKTFKVLGFLILFIQTIRLVLEFLKTWNLFH